MQEQLMRRRTALQLAREHLDRGAQLTLPNGRRYMQALTMLVVTQMQIEEHEKGRSGKRPV